MTNYNDCKCEDGLVKDSDGQMSHECANCDYFNQLSEEITAVMATDKSLTIHRRHVLKGYMAILEQAPPNGRYAHAKAQPITALRLSLALDLDIDAGYEIGIKNLIRSIYNDYKSDGSSYVARNDGRIKTDLD